MNENLEKPARIAKVLARAGVASRREVERMIADGRISVDGVVLDTPAFLVTSEHQIAVDGNIVGGPEKTRLWLYHKPVDLLVSHGDPDGRPTVFEVLPDEMPRVISVGRLDLSSEGLLLLTNNGALAQFLEHPSTGWTRHYRVRGYGVPYERKMKDIREGVTVEGVHYAPVAIEEEEGGRTNRWYTLALKEGKNREVRRLMEYAGVKVNRLLRTSYGPFQLGSLPVNTLREVSTDVLKQQLGVNAEEFGL
jgi:23S rRNA pseudouridine2605 synthase